MRIIYPNGIIIECTRDEYLECIKDEQVQSQKEVINAINDFKQALLAKTDSIKDIANAGLLLFQKFCEEYFKNITVVTHGDSDSDEILRKLREGQFEYEPPKVQDNEFLRHVPLGTSVSAGGAVEHENTSETDVTTNSEHISFTGETIENSEEMLKQIIHAYKSDRINPVDINNPDEKYESPKEAADAHNLSIQEFMKYLDSDTIYNGYIFMSEKKAKQRATKTKKNSKSQQVYVYNENWDNERVFDSVTQASRMLAVAILTIKNNMDNEKLVKHKYYFRSRKLPKTETTVLDNSQYLADTTNKDIPEIEKTMREIKKRNKEPYEPSHPIR